MDSILKSKFPYVSIIIPCYNEERFIKKCLDSVIENDFSKDKLEVLVIDGMSKDTTREIVERYREQNQFISLLDDNKKNTPAALNIGIKEAKGEIIMFMSSHASYEKEYISKCVYYLDKLNADNVGGVFVTLPGDDTFIAKAISLALSSPFGVGNSFFRIGAKKPMLVDTVPFGCYRKTVFEKIGGFNDKLIRTEDNELNYRLRKSGGKIYLIPDIKLYYYARSNLKDLGKQSFGNGKSIVYANKIVPGSTSLRHSVPGIFVICLLGSLILFLITSWGKLLFYFILFSYLATNTYFSIQMGLKEKLRFAPYLIVSFITLHISNGLGFLMGILDIIFKQHLKK